MSGSEQLRRYMVRGEGMPGKLGRLQHGIEFMREELGVPPAGLPDSLNEAEREHADLRSRVEPPSDRQVARLRTLLRQTGGVLSGEVCSRGQASLLIEELGRVRIVQQSKADELAFQRLRSNRIERWGKLERRLLPMLGWGMALVGSLGLLASALIWPVSTYVYGLLGLAVAFVVIGGIHVLGLWR